MWGLGASHCAQLLNPASVREVDEAIFRTAEAASDTLLLYYTGHGLLDRKGRLHLALPDSNERSVHSTAFPYDWVRMGLAAGSAQRCTVVLDRRFSARATGLQSSPSSVVELAEAEGTYVLAAAAENAFALAPPGEAYTAFTGALVGVLSDGTADAPQLLDLDTVFMGVQSILKRQGRPDPQCLGRNQIGRTAFAKNPAYVPEQAYDLEEAIQSLHTARGLADTLQTIADGMVDGLGYGPACLNLVRPDGDLVVAALAGNSAAEAVITGRIDSRASWEGRLTMGEAWGTHRALGGAEGGGGDPPEQPGLAADLGELGDGPLVGPMQRGPDDRRDLGRGRWLDQIHAHLPQQLGPHLFLAAFVVPDHVHQVRDELDQVGLRALVPPGQIPQLAAVPLRGAGGEVIQAQLGRGDAHLLATCSAASGGSSRRILGKRPRQVKNFS
jgi:hypothetical protein